MVAKNDITGDNIQSRGNSKAYQDNLEKIFGDKSEEKERKAREKAEYFARLNAEYEDKVTRNNEETQQTMRG
jgi:lauroyl/myristoyl acyltransferase